MTPPRINLPSGLCACLNINCPIVYGTCHCGCGGKTAIAKATEIKKGCYIGRPKQWLNGHVSIKHPIIENAHPFKIGDEYCRLIPLSKGLYAIVSAVDYLWLMQWKWYAIKRKNGRGYYAVRTVLENGKQSTILMHREVLKLDRRDKRQVDHKDRLNSLDNRRGNLRDASETQNRANTGTPSHNKSGLKGACFATGKGRWLAQIQYKGVRYFLGYFDTKEEAHAAYWEAAQRLFGEFACAG